MQFNDSNIKLIVTNSNNYNNIEDVFHFFCKEINIKNDDLISEELQGEILYIGILINKNLQLLNRKNIKNWITKSSNYHFNVDIVLVNENNVEVSTISNKFHLLQENYFDNDYKTIYKKIIAKRKDRNCSSQENYFKKKNNDELPNYVKDKKHGNVLYNLKDEANDKILYNNKLDDIIFIDLVNNKYLNEEMENFFFLNNSSYYIEGLIYIIELPLTISQKYINKELILRVQLFENMKRERKKNFTFLNQKHANDLKDVFESPSLLLNNIQWSSTFTSDALYEKIKKNKISNVNDDDEGNNFFLDIYDEKNYKDSKHNFPLNVNLHNICNSLNKYGAFMYKSTSKNNCKSLILNKSIIVVKPLDIKYKIIDRYLYLEIANITKNNKIEIYELFSRSLNIESNIFPFSLYPEDMHSFFFPILNFVQLLPLNDIKRKNSTEKKKKSVESINNTKYPKIIEKYKNNNEILSFCFNSDKIIISFCLKWCIDNTSNNFIWSQYCIEVEIPAQNIFDLEISFVKEINYSSILIAVFSFYNNHHEDIDLTIQIQDYNNINNDMHSSLISFNSLIDVGIIKPYQRKSVNFKLLSIMLGLHNFPYVKIKNKLTNKFYLIDLGSILVTE